MSSYVFDLDKMPGKYAFDFYHVGHLCLSILKREIKMVFSGLSAWVWFYFLICVDVILPHFNKNTFDFVSIYGPLGKSLGQVAI